MALDGITVAALVHELDRTITGGRIAKIAQPEKENTVRMPLLHFQILSSHGGQLGHGGCSLSL